MAKYLLEEHSMNIRSLHYSIHGKSGKSSNLKMSKLFKLMHCFCENVEMQWRMCNRTVVLKLPYKLREKWRASACDIQEQCKRRAQFTDIVTFIEHHVKTVSYPVFGDIQNTQSVTVSKNVDRMKSQSKFKGESFATTIETLTMKNPRNSRQLQSISSGKNINICVNCSQGHQLEHCQQLEEKKHRDKINFLKEKGVCFGCLYIGHRSKDCEKCLTHKVYSQTHPSILHINQQVRASNTDQPRSKQAKEP